MCDDCKDSPEILRMLRVPSELPDAVTRAAKRLRCYYECVTRDEDIFEESEDPDDDLEDWEPEY